MKHYGDITKMHGNEIEPVWLITGGSPCQDLSVAGKRAGLAGERSGLFMEMIRVIKEMRDRDGMDGRADQLIRPRFVLWENVPGALSSNNGEDFRCVLEEFCRVKEKDICIPRPPKGKWPNAGSIVGDGWSLGWRVRDAQYWGVPQRRRRIALLVDYGGMDAAKILFEQCSGREPRSQVRSVGKGVSGDTGESEEAGQGTSDDPAGGPGSAGCLNPWDVQSKHIQTVGGAIMSISHDVTSSLRAQMRHHEPIVLVYDARGNGGGVTAPTITGNHQDRITDYTAIVVSKNAESDVHGEEIF